MIPVATMPYLLITDRDGKILYKSPKVSARDLVPADAGKESAKKLFDKKSHHDNWNSKVNQTKMKVS